MALPFFQKANDSSFQQMQTAWAAQINPVIANLLVNGQLLKDVAIVNGTTIINHKLGRVMQGWIITDIDGGSAIYRSQPFNNLTLTLVSGGNCTASIWVF